MNPAFTKMHGLGNDFVIVDHRVSGGTPPEPLRRRIADRHRGIGCDQLIILLPPQDRAAALYMDMYNADGSSAGACGNATRCVARLLLEESGNDKAIIQTISGLLSCSRLPNGDIAVDFGMPGLNWTQIPLAFSTDTQRLELSVGELSYPGCVNMGNPHAVFFVPDIETVPLNILGPQLETHPIFPDRANIEIAQVVTRSHIRMRVWERGAGITQACGSGACAVVVAAARRGLSNRQATVTLDGGDLLVQWREDDHVILSGPASLSYRGEWSAELLAGI